MRIGYAYSSKVEQQQEKQLLRLKESGCERIYHEILPDLRSERIQLKKCLDSLRSGDTLVICRLDRIGYRVEQALELVDELFRMGVTFISLDDNLRISGLTGQVLSHFAQVLTDMKEDVFKARCLEGRIEAKKKGVKFGRKEGSVNKHNRNKPQQCRQLYDNGLPISRIMTLLNIRSYSTIYRYLKQTAPSVAKEDAVKPARLSKKELQKLKNEAFDHSHQLYLF